MQSMLAAPSVKVVSFLLCFTRTQIGWDKAPSASSKDDLFLLVHPGTGDSAYIRMRDVALRATLPPIYNEHTEACMSNSPFLAVEQSCEQMLQWTSEQLTGAGLYTVQTFNLHTVRTDVHGCPCPGHGSSECVCQVGSLLGIWEIMEPVTLVLHEHEGQTWLSIAETAESRPKAGLVKSIRQVLEQFQNPQTGV